MLLLYSEISKQRALHYLDPNSIQYHRHFGSGSGPDRHFPSVATNNALPAFGISLLHARIKTHGKLDGNQPSVWPLSA